MTTPIQPATTTPLPPAAPGLVPAAPPQEELTQFLSLLTTQIRNQDPLQPLDSTAFTEQLATFSALEQQVEANGHLAAIVALLTAEVAEGE